jgi:hypothetical protein
MESRQLKLRVVQLVKDVIVDGRISIRIVVNSRIMVMTNSNIAIAHLLKIVNHVQILLG